MIRSLGLAVLLAAASAPVAQAAAITKAGTGTDLTAGASWTGSAAPGSADVATWSSSSLGASLTLGSAASWAGINITGALTDIGVTGAGVLTLGTSGITVAGTGPANSYFDLNVTFSGNSNVNVGSTRNLVLGRGGRTVTFGAGTTTTLNGTGNFTLGGTGATTITGSGNITINSGAIYRNYIQTNSSSSGFTGTTTLSAGGTMYSQTSLDSLGGSSANFIINGGTIGSDSGAGARLFGGSATITIGGNFIVANSGGSSVITLGSATSSMNLGNAVRSVTATSSTVLAGIISNGAGAAAGGLTKLGTGTLDITNAANTFTGQVTLTGSGATSVTKLANAGSNSSLGTGSSASSIIFNGGTLAYTGTGDSTNRAIDMRVNTAINNNGTGALNFTAANVIQGGVASVRALTLGGNSAANITNSFGSIYGNSGANANTFIKNGSGTWALTGANTFTGTVSISSGILSVASLNSVSGGSANSNLGAPVTVANGTIWIGSTTSTGTLLYTGSGETTDRVITLSGTTGGATIDQSGTGLLKFTSAFTTQANGVKAVTLQGSTAGTGEIAGNIVNSTLATSVTKAGTGLWTLSGASSSYTGVTAVNAGTLKLGSALALGSTTGGTTVASGAVLDLNGQAIGAEAITSITGTGLTASPAGALVNSNAGAGASLSGAVTMVGNTSIGGAGNLTLSGVVGGAFDITKVGAGTLTLSNAANTYANTTVSAGTLSVTGTIGGTTTVASGATLNGSGTVGAVTLQNGSTLTAGVTNAGSLTLGNLSVDANATVTLNIGNLSNYANSAAFAAGALTMNSGSVVNLTVSGFAIGNGYQLLTYTGSNPFTTGLGGNLVLNSLNTGRLNVTLNTATAGLIAYDVTGNKNYWTGAASGVWQASGAANWSIVSDADSTVFLAGDSIVFDGTGANNAITIAEQVSPGTIEVSGANDYSFSGSFGIAGTGSLTKTGNGKLTLNTANTFSGGASLQQGRVVVGADTALGSGVVTLAGSSISTVTGTSRAITNNVSVTQDTILGDTTDNGTLTFSTGGFALAGTGARTLDVRSAVTLGGSLSGNGLIKSGTGTLTLSGANGSYAGGVTVSNGTLVVGGTTALGSGAVSVSGAALILAASPTGAGAFSLGTGAAVASDGATARTVASALTLSGNVTLGDATNTGGITFSSTVALADGNRTITTAAGTTSTLSGIVSSATAASGAITKEGAGTLVLSNANTYAGGTTLNAGVLQVGNATSLGSGALTVNGGTLTSGSTQLTLTNAITLNSTVSFTGTAGSQGMRLDGAITGTGGINVNLGSGGRATLNGTNDFTGATNIVTGLLAIGLNSLAQSSSVTVASGTTLAVGANGGTTLINNLSGSGSISTAFNIVSDGVRPIKVTQTVDGTFDGAITEGTTTRKITLTKTGAASLTLGGATASSYTGGVVLSQGTIVANSVTALGSSGTGVTVNDADTGSGNTTLLINNLVLARPITIANFGSGTVTLGANGAVALPEFSGAITLAKDVTLDGSTNSDRLTFSGGIGGTGNLSITGTGRVVFLTTANTYVGNTDIAAGSILQVGTGTSSVNFLPDATVVTVGAGGYLKLAKGSNNETIAGLSGSGTVRAHEGVNSAAATLTIANSADYNFSGVLENGGATGTTLAFAKSGAGKQTLSGANTYTGGTSVSGGTLEVTGTLGSGSYAGAITLSNNAVLSMASNSAQELSGSISGTGSLTKSGNGNLTLSVSSNSATSTTVTGGTLTAGTANAFGSNAVSVSNGAAINLGAQTIGNTISLDNATLSGASAFTGTATVASTASVSGSIGGTFNTGLANTSTTVTAGANTNFTGTLKGQGTITGNITVSGAHNPGNSPGIQTITGNLEYANGATITMEIWDQSTTANFDQVIVGGNLTFGTTTLTLQFGATGSSVDWDASFWNTYHRWTLFDASGSLDAAKLSLVGAAATFDNRLTNGNYADASGAILSDSRLQAGFYIRSVGNNVELVYRPIPEPSTYGLAIGGLALAAVAIRRRRKLSK